MHLPPNRSKAKELGINYYYTGSPCKHGHKAKRKTLNGECCECARIYRVTSGKELRKQATLKWRSKNTDKVKQHKKTEYENNKQCYIDKAKDWASDNWDIVKETKRRWASNNRPYGAMKRRERTARLRKALPVWADITYVKDLYENCAEFNQILRDFGLSEKYTLDHIVPIKSDFVCGLHCEFNLQILTLEDNSSKNNRHTEISYDFGT